MSHPTVTLGALTDWAHRHRKLTAIIVGLIGVAAAITLVLVS